MLDEIGISREEQKRIDAHLYQRALYVVMTTESTANSTKLRLMRELAAVPAGGKEEQLFEQAQMEITQERAMRRDNEKKWSAK